VSKLQSIHPSSYFEDDDVVLPFMFCNWWRWLRNRPKRTMVVMESEWIGESDGRDRSGGGDDNCLGDSGRRGVSSGD
jgi:hypothetical protein